MSIESAGPTIRDARRALTLSEAAFYHVMAMSVLFLTAWLLSWTRYGLDFTDESFYLNWIRSPHLYEFSVTQFGFFYHYAFFPLHDDVVWLRAANIAALLGTGWLFGFILLRTLFFDSHGVGGRLAAASASLPLGFAAILPIANWLPTPSYNSLTLKGLLLAASALVAIARGSARPSVWQFILLAVGGWLCFLAKPSSAALLALVALAYILLQGKAELKGLAVAAGTSVSLLLLTALVIDGSVLVFIGRMADAAATVPVLDPRQQFMDLLRFGLPNLDSRSEWQLLGLTTALAAVLLACSAVSSRWRSAGLAVALGMIALGSAMVLSDGALLFVNWSPMLPLQMLAVPLGIVLALTLAVAFNFRASVSWELASLAVLLATLPYVYAFGTNNDYWRQAAGAAIFWVASALVLWRAVGAKPSPRLILIPALAATYALVTTVMIAGLQAPYRQRQPLQMNETTAVVGPAGSQLVLSADSAAYVGRLDQLASEGGFRPQTPLVDLTGHSPGAAYVLAAKAIGLPWMIGGYPGSENLARIALGRVPCTTLARSWLLTEPDGRRALPVSLMTELGMHYAAQGELNSPATSFPQSYRQVLMRPVHDPDAAIAACERRGAAEDS